MASQLLLPPQGVGSFEENDATKRSLVTRTTSHHSSFSSCKSEVPPLARSLASFVRSMHQPAERQVQIHYFINERGFKERLQAYFIQNRLSSFCIRLFNVVIKLLSCVLYCVRVVNDGGEPPPGIAHSDDYYNYSNDSTRIQVEKIIWVDRPAYLWLCQTTVGIISFIQTVLIFYISYKGNIFRLLWSSHFLLELITSIPFIVTIFVPTWREVFIPGFMSCWLAKTALQAMLNDLNRATQRQQSALFQQMIILFSTFICLIFTSTCGIQHLQRAGKRQMNLFEAFYFIIVTFSTVGFGDLYPDTWMSQLYVIVMIAIALAVLPKQIEQLGHTWMERQRSGGDYSKRRAKYERHVVVTVTYLQAEVVLDFLNEFYAHPKLQDFFVILLSPCDLDNTMRILLQLPQWTERVIYMRGSALKDADLERARMTDAECCFILSARNNPNKPAADEHTILRSWAVKDYAPKCPQYVQIFRPETKMHVKHAEHVICEDEFKYALLANNCICPGISTFITLLMHTSRGEEGQNSSEPWHQLYGRHSGNEIYHIRLSESKFFGEYEGKSFTYASFHAHRKYGVCMVGVQKEASGSTIQLNPGQRHTMRATDICYYMALTKEELSSIQPIHADGKRKDSSVANTIASIGTLALELQHTHTRTQPPASPKTKPKANEKMKKKLSWMNTRQTPLEETITLEVHPVARKPSIGVVPDSFEASRQASSRSSSEECESRESCSVADIDLCQVCGINCIEKQLSRSFPPVTPYIGTSATICHIHKEKRFVCCLQLTQPCSHCSFNTAKQYDWTNPAIIVAADHASSALYNFVIPLRAHYRPVHELHPIVLLLEQKPEDSFLDAVSWFPLVYWLRGSVSNLDNLLRAGICLADHVVLVKEGFTAVEEHLADCNTIVTVQTVHRLFPSLRVITELTHSSNMRFMQFNAKDLYALHQSKFEKKEKERGSHMAYMFRLPFAEGSVFSANMLDTLLYQAFVKEYLVHFVRLLLGIDQAVGSGYLASFKLQEDDMWIRTYGRLYQKLCSSAADIPIGIFRTKRMDSTTISVEMEQLQQSLEEEDTKTEEEMLHRRFSSKFLCSERHEISNLVRNRMHSLGLPDEDYYYASEARGTVAFVIINPGFDMKLEPGDVVYVLKPPTAQNNARGPRAHSRKGMRRKLSSSRPPANPDDSQSPDRPIIYQEHQRHEPPPYTRPTRASFFNNVPTVVLNNNQL